jgi:hypothetical protein
MASLVRMDVVREEQRRRSLLVARPVEPRPERPALYGMGLVLLSRSSQALVGVRDDHVPMHKRPDEREPQIDAQSLRRAVHLASGRTRVATVRYGTIRLAVVLDHEVGKREIRAERFRAVAKHAGDEGSIPLDVHAGRVDGFTPR